MTFDIAAGGARRTVTLRRDGDAWGVTVDGRAVAVDVVRAGGRWSLLVGRRSYEVAVEPRGAGELVVYVNGRAVPVSVARAGARRRGSHAGAAGDGPATIAAPMPGRIVKLLVRPGDAVGARQGLVVVEAMKMENELRAPRAGTVREVRVAEGASVEAGAALVVLD